MNMALNFSCFQRKGFQIRFNLGMIEGEYDAYLSFAHYNPCSVNYFDYLKKMLKNICTFNSFDEPANRSCNDMRCTKYMFTVW